MEVEQVESEQQIALQVPNKPGKRVRVIVHDEQKPRPKLPPRQHISFRFADSAQSGSLKLLPPGHENMTLQEQYAALGTAATVSVETFYRVLRECGGLSDQLPLKLALSSEEDRICVKDFDFNAPGYHGENSWPFEWQGLRCALVTAPNHFFIQVYQCSLEQALATIRSIQCELLKHKSNARPTGKQKELLISVPQELPMGLGFKWVTLSARNHRSLDTLYLPPEKKKELIEPLERFTGSAALYEEYGVTWKYCMLLSGPPGCGKTTSVQALCCHFGWNLSKLTLSPSFNSQTMEKMLQQMPVGDALLLEDVDALFVDRQANTGIDCSTILNLLDGVATRRGLVIFMTSNYPERLDGALRRDGRVDQHVQLREAGPAEKRQLIKRMGDKMWTAEQQETLLEKYSHWSMAALQQHMFACIKDGRKSLIDDDEKETQ